MILGAVLAVAVFCLASAYDAVNGIYYQAQRTGRAGRASACAVVLCAIAAVAGWLFFKVSSWYIVPEAAGYGFGTYVITRWLRDRD